MVDDFFAVGAASTDNAEALNLMDFDAFNQKLVQGNLQAYELRAGSTQVPPFRQGFDAHSLISFSHLEF